MLAKPYLVVVHSARKMLSSVSNVLCAGIFCFATTVFLVNIDVFLTCSYALANNSQQSRGVLPYDVATRSLNLISVSVFSINPEIHDIDTLAISGSGTIVHRKGGKSYHTYIVLTSGHTLPRIGERAYIRTHDGIIHAAYEFSRGNAFFNRSEVDLGVLWFRSPITYPVSRIEQSAATEARDDLSAYIAGFPCNRTGPVDSEYECQIDAFHLIEAKAYEIPKSLVDGYQIGLREGMMKEGMSEGGIFDMYGRLIGTFGRGPDTKGARQYRFQDGSGFLSDVIHWNGPSPSLGVPINIYLHLDHIFAFPSDFSVQEIPFSINDLAANDLAAQELTFKYDALARSKTKSNKHNDWISEKVRSGSRFLDHFRSPSLSTILIVLVAIVIVTATSLCLFRELKICGQMKVRLVINFDKHGNRLEIKESVYNHKKTELSISPKHARVDISDLKISSHEETLNKVQLKVELVDPWPATRILCPTSHFLLDIAYSSHRDKKVAFGKKDNHWEFQFSFTDGEEIFPINVFLICRSSSVL